MNKYIEQLKKKEPPEETQSLTGILSTILGKVKGLERFGEMANKLEGTEKIPLEEEKEEETETTITRKFSSPVIRYISEILQSWGILSGKISDNLTPELQEIILKINDMLAKPIDDPISPDGIREFLKTIRNLSTKERKTIIDSLTMTTTEG